MPVQGFTLAHIRRPQCVEQLAGGSLDQLRHHHLRRRRFNLGRHIGGALGGIIPAKPRHVGLLCRQRGFQRTGFGSIDQRRDVTHHLLHLRIRADMGRIAMAVDALAAAHLLGHVVQRGAADPGQAGQ